MSGKVVDEAMCDCKHAIGTEEHREVISYRIRVAEFEIFQWVAFHKQGIC